VDDPSAEIILVLFPAFREARPDLGELVGARQIPQHQSLEDRIAQEAQTLEAVVRGTPVVVGTSEAVIAIRNVPPASAEWLSEASKSAAAAVGVKRAIFPMSMADLRTLPPGEFQFSCWLSKHRANRQATSRWGSVRTVSTRDQPITAVRELRRYGAGPVKLGSGTKPPFDTAAD